VTNNRQTAIALFAFVATVATFPFLLSSNYTLGVGTSAGAMAVGTVGFVLLIGYAHQLALGQAAFCMIGGYASALLCSPHSWDPIYAVVALIDGTAAKRLLDGMDPALAVLLGVLASMALAYLFGKPILRLRGYLLGMASLALQFILIYAAEELPTTNGALGIGGVPKFAIAGFRFESDTAYFYVCWAVVLGAVAIGLNIDRSPVGRALRSIAASEMAAASVGVDIPRVKLQMFVISAAMASISGSLTVHYLRFMEPGLFGFGYSLNIITSVVVGGLTSIWGGVIGAIAMIGIRELLRDLAIPVWEPVIMGVLTTLVLIVFPTGIAGLLSTAYARLAQRRARCATFIANGTRPSTLEPFKSSDGNHSRLLEVRGVSRAFGSLKAVDDVTFTVPAGEITALIGPNGAGKTTIFNLVCGYEALDAGEIKLEGRSIGTLLPNEVAALGVGRTFQDLQLFNNMTVAENVMCGAYRRASLGLFSISAGLPHIRRQESELRAVALSNLGFVGLEAVANRFPSELPFGHQRLLDIARALALKPRILLMDEPASGLNDSETEKLAELIVRIVKLGVTVLLVEHDIRLVMGISDHVVVLHHGQTITEGTPRAIRHDERVISAYLGM
jgi:branched-chain amino acid transport system permease protein